jgi:hypothetical protein
MAIQLNDNVKINAPKPGEYRYLSPLNLPYTGLTHVYNSISSGERFLGLTVLIRDVEYWFQQGTANGDLVPKDGVGIINPSFCQVLIGVEPNQVGDPFKRETIVSVGTPISGNTKFFWMFSVPTKVKANSISIKDETNSVYIATGLTTNNYNSYNAGYAVINIGNIPNNSPMTHVWRIELKNVYNETIQSSQLKITSI